MSFNFKIRLMQICCQLIGVYAIYYLIITQEYSWLYVTIPMYILLSPINTGMILHRLLTHRSFKTHQWLENVLSIITVFSTIGTTVAWVGLHRFHHVHADSAADPHTPYDPITGKFSLKQAAIAWSGIGWNIPNIPVKFKLEEYSEK